MTKEFQPAWQKDEVSKGISELTYLTEACSNLDLQSSQLRPADLHGSNHFIPAIVVSQLGCLQTKGYMMRRDEDLLQARTRELLVP